MRGMPGMPGGGMDLNKMLKQAQKMQEAMGKVQADLANRTVEGSSGGGAVIVVATGAQEIKAIRIKPEAVDPEDVETLEDLVLTAVRDALQKASALAQQEMGSVTGGLNLPGF